MRKTLLALAAVSSLLAVTANATSGTYAIDPGHTYATFEIGHFGTSTNRGRMDKKEGTVVFDRAAKTGKVDISIDATSVNTGNEVLNKEIAGPGIFNAAAYPTIKFSGDKLSFEGDKVTQVAGTLTLLGKTLPVTLKANHFNCYQNPMVKREVCGGDFETTIDRTQWGLNYGLDWGFPKEVRLVIQVEAVQQ
jgi:polyisoprenoid-binding protein YceI